MAHVYRNSTDELEKHIREEVEFPGELGISSRGVQAKRVQEWLTLQGFAVVVDGDFGPATERATYDFQEERGLAASGKIDEITFNCLVDPMIKVVQQRLTQSIPFADAVLAYAGAHLDVHPMEVGGANRGPWVRLYMRGHEGTEYAWCAGFMTFLMDQAADSLQIAKPIDGSFSCDSLAAQARQAALFLAEADASSQTVTPGSLFLVRRTGWDWTHTGLVVQAFDDSLQTIEGNTNDDGDREGYEVCARTRNYASKEFVLL